MTPPTTHHPTNAGPKEVPNRPPPNGDSPLMNGNRVAQVAIGVLRRLTSPPPQQFGSAHGVVYQAAYISTIALRLAGTGLTVWVAQIHLDLWSEGYRHIPSNGPLFLADAIGGFVVAAILLVWPRPLTALLGTGYLVSTLAALIISINVGLFGFQESIRASFVVESILLESLGAALLLAWPAIVMLGRPKLKDPSDRRVP